MAFTGIVKCYDTQKGFGFIVSNGHVQDLFVLRTDVLGDTLVKGDQCQFDEAMNKLTGQPKAVNVVGGTGGPDQGKGGGCKGGVIGGMMGGKGKKGGGKGKKGGYDESGKALPCKDGAQCARANCWFSHPAVQSSLAVKLAKKNSGFKDSETFPSLLRDLKMPVFLLSYFWLFVFFLALSIVIQAHYITTEHRGNP
ncbi:unnamed protein product [Polarella glacialis]|uniref:CSD domain-containing protein n=1 Tax=Polarella glacialis TaxID=89957 RepID=A0A813FJU1_POLGL|nr:unnamed protein product [Polarella glacialis]CAE8720591.1 unnamed protein product [Polarella glacialis]